MELQSSIRWHSIALAVLTYAIDAPFYLLLTRASWPITPAWVVPALIVICTTCGLLGVAIQDRLGDAGIRRIVSGEMVVLVLASVVPIGLALLAGYLQLTLWARLYPAGGNWLGSMGVLFVAALVAGLAPLCLFSTLRTAKALLVFYGALTCVALTLPDPISSWSLVPSEYRLGGPYLFVLMLIVALAALFVVSGREESRSWLRRRVRVHADAPAISRAQGAIIVVGLCVWTFIPVLLNSSLLPKSSGLEVLWHQYDPLTGHLPFSAVARSGTPLLLPATTISLGSPDVTSTAVVLTWRLQQATTSGGTPQNPEPFILATYDEFTPAGIWAASPTRTGAVGATLQTVSDAGTIIARVTPQNGLPSTTLAVFDGSTHIVGAQPLLIGSGSSTLDLASWRSVTPISHGQPYLDTASVLSPSDLQAQVASAGGSLSAAEMSRLLEVPSSLRPTLQALVSEWTHPTMSPLQTAEALAEGMRATYTLVAQPASGQNQSGPALLNALLTTRRGNAATWATLHVLLCRVAGLPARLASGFTPGTQNTHTGTFTVQADDATWMTQIATTAGWLHVGVLDHVLPELLPQKSASSVSVPPPVRPTPPTMGVKIPQPRPQPKKRQSHTRQTLPLQGVLLLMLLIAATCGVVVWLVRWLWARYSRQHGPLEREVRWLLLLLIRAGYRVVVRTLPGVEGRELTPRQVGSVLAPHLPNPLGKRVRALSELANQLTYARGLPVGPPTPRQQLRTIAREARRALRDHKGARSTTRPTAERGIR